MSKTLRTAAIVVGAVALVATGVGAAASIGAFGAVAAGSATAATLATVSTIATISSFAAGALTVGATLTAKKPSAISTGSPDQFAADPQAFVPYVIGRTATSGQIVFRRAWDTADKGENDRQSFVVSLSLGPIQEIIAFHVDKQPVNFAGGAAGGSYAGFMWQMQQLGACPENAALGFGSGAGVPPGWGSDRKLSGLAAATWTLKWDAKAKQFQNGVPTPRWILRGAKAYDPRQDSTYPGGSGAQRAANEATWTYSENPYLHALTWCLGRHQNGQRVIGLGAPVAGIDVAAFVEGANVADLNGWKVAGVIYSGDDKWDTLKKILQAGMGEPLQLGASISCLVNAPRVSLGTIGIGDVVGDASVTATQPRRSRINGVVPRYRQEANDWQLLPGTAVRVPEHEAEDGGRRTREVDYAFIPSDNAGPDGGDKQVAVAARYDIENAREFGPIVLPLKLRWIGFKPGDCVTANLPELGLENRTILLLNRDFDPSTGMVTFTARSETAGKHAFALGQVSSPPPTPGVSAPPLVPVPGANAWAITGTQVGNTGAVVPALVIDGAVDSPVAEAIVVEYRRFITGQAAGAGWIAASTLPPTATRTIITALQPSTAYEVAISYRRRGVTGARAVLGPATTTNAPASQRIQGSTNGSNWHDGLQAGDQYIRTSLDGGLTWGPSVPLGGDASAALLAIERIQSDNWLTKGEKGEFIRLHQKLLTDSMAAHTASVALSTTFGGDPTGVQRAARDTAHNAYVDYVNGFAPAYDDVSQDTPIDGPTLRTRHANLLAAVAALQNANTTFSNGRVSQAESNLVAIFADNVLSRDEKPLNHTEHYQRNIRFQKFDQRYAALGNPSAVTATRNAASTALSNLNSYTNGIIPSYADFTTDSPIDGGVYRQRYRDMDDALAAFEAALTAQPGPQGPPGPAGASGVPQTINYGPTNGNFSSQQGIIYSNNFQVPPGLRLSLQVSVSYAANPNGNQPIRLTANIFCEGLNPNFVGGAEGTISRYDDADQAQYRGNVTYTASVYNGTGATQSARLIVGLYQSTGPSTNCDVQASATVGLAI